ncbi:hypothetical protein SPF06_01140 [Sinomonas sp. JGH33]|uniref:Uncharacterized protein n=1 Tax=Sinomonas terricola TaxID=3110330 RepID=A0ABU5T0X9_9MICC|nr:hypothetical protein [Sinomonas sp. JGH33]MEA5453316.1 hypothetical protein [Sinomonas sp. JGH33]
MMPVFVVGCMIGAGIGLTVGGIMYARILYSFVERGEADYILHRL